MDEDHPSSFSSLSQVKTIDQIHHDNKGWTLCVIHNDWNPSKIDIQQIFQKGWMHAKSGSILTSNFFQGKERKKKKTF
jgi:hypothetical protein